MRARRGAQLALVARGGKLRLPFWQLLSGEEDYAFGGPSLSRHKLRRLELLAGDPPRRGRRSGSSASGREQRHERELSERVERAYRRLVADWQQRPNKGGAVRHRGAHLQVSERDKQRGSERPQALRLGSSSPAPGQPSQRRPTPSSGT